MIFISSWYNFEDWKCSSIYILFFNLHDDIVFPPKRFQNIILLICLIFSEVDENHVHMENVPYAVYEDLSLKLNPEEMNNWRKLASYLKVSNDKIRNFALQPHLATQKLLDEWVIQPNATAYNLHTVLTQMGRLDAAAILEPYLYKHFNSTVWPLGEVSIFRGGRLN